MKLSVSECVWDAVITTLGFSSDSSGKESACSAGGAGLISGSGRFPGEGDGDPLQYSCLGNPMDRGAWQATVHGVEKSQTRLSNWAHTMTRWPPKFSPWNLRCGLSVRPGWWPGSHPTGSQQEEREGASPASGWHSFAVSSTTVIHWGCDRCEYCDLADSWQAARWLMYFLFQSQHPGWARNNPETPPSALGDLLCFWEEWAWTSLL